MSIYIAFTLFSLIILLYWVIAELFTILFRFTGLPDEKARFQVISLLTGCGFTTRESELFLSSRGRRRLARVTMLFGYVFNITIVSTLINVFLSLKLAQVEAHVLSLLIPLTAAAAAVVLLRVPAVRGWADRRLEVLAGRLVQADASNTVLLLDYIGQDSIAQVLLRTVPERLRDVPLSDAGLRSEENLLVMLVESPGKKAVPAAADTRFREGDKLTVFGNYGAICRVFQAKERFTE